MPPGTNSFAGEYVADLREGKITQQEFVLLHILADHEDPETALANITPRFISELYNLTYRQVRNSLERLEVKKYVKNFSSRGKGRGFGRGLWRSYVQKGAKLGMVLDVENSTSCENLVYLDGEVVAEKWRGLWRGSWRSANKPKYRSDTLKESGRSSSSVETTHAPTAFVFKSAYLKVSQKQHEIIAKEFHQDPTQYYPEIHIWLESRGEHAQSPLGIIRKWMENLTAPGGNGNGNGTNPSNGNGFKSIAARRIEERQKATREAIDSVLGPDREVDPDSL